MITLKRLEVNNFKSLRSVTLVFPEQGTVLIEGYNEAGKSTLFEAVYVALYGKPLVGEDKVARQEEVIQYGQSHAMVQLTFCISQHEFVISRHFERGKSQQAKLLIQQPGVQPEEVNRVRAVDERILKELGNLDGDSLRNSCFVEQKELGRIEALSLDQRKQAIQKLLGLERLTQLMDQFKFRRDQESELTLAQNYLKLAQLQAEVRKATAEESELAKRLDAVKVAIQVKHLIDLKKQKEEMEQRLGECISRVQEARDRLNRCETLKEYSSQCDQVSHQVTAIAHARTELLRITGDLERLDTIEQVELPKARAYLNDVRSASEAVAQSVQARKQAQEAQEACREAERNVKELEQAEADQRGKEDELTRAQERVVQRHKEAEMEQQGFLRKLSELEAGRMRLVNALALVKQWESANGALLVLRKEISVVEEKEQALLKLQNEIQQREDGVRNLENAETLAEREMKQAIEAARMAAAYEALTAWTRLKGVEMTLGGYTTQHNELITRHQKAEMSLATARAKLRMPLFAGIALGVLALFAFILSLLGLPAIAFFAIFLLLGDTLAWLWYFRALRSKQKYSNALFHWRLELQRLDMQRQAAIQTGGDPVTLNQYEQPILASGLAVPSSLEAGRNLQEELRRQLGTTKGNHALQESAQNARDNYTRLVEQLRQARSAVEGMRQKLYLALQSGNPVEQLAQLKTRAAAQEKRAATDEETARQSLAEVAQWPTDSNTLQTLLSTCQAEIRTTDETRKRQAEASARLIREAEADKEKAEQLMQQVRVKVATLMANNPAGQFSRAQENLAEVEMLCQQRDRATRPLLNKIHLQFETEVEAARGRAEARIQELRNAVANRSLLQEKYTKCNDSITDSLKTTISLIQSLLAALNSLAFTGLPALPQLSKDGDVSFPYEQNLTATLNEIRKALQTTLVTLDEQGTRDILDEALSEQGRINQQREGVEDDMKRSQQAIDAIFSSRKIAYQSTYNYESIVKCWPFIALVPPNEEGQVAQNLEEVRKRLYAACQRESQLAAELHDPGTPLSIEDCQQRVDELFEARKICGWATRLLKETYDRIARRVLPITERNMQPLLQQLTGGRYRDVRLTPEDTDGQPVEMDYRIRVWDPAAGRYIAKNIFSGGTRDQCSLALRLAFALATLPQELGVAPGFIFLDEPLSAFDSLRAQALVDLITTGTIAQQFNQVILISHQHAFNREAFQYHVRMDAGQIVESDLPHSEDDPTESIQLQPVGAVGD
jgi:DNA repair exonuclease SbcCD ATPase subunit